MFHRSEAITPSGLKAETSNSPLHQSLGVSLFEVKMRGQFGGEHDVIVPGVQRLGALLGLGDVRQVLHLVPRHARTSAAELRGSHVIEDQRHIRDEVLRNLLEALNGPHLR